MTFPIELSGLRLGGGSNPLGECDQTMTDSSLLQEIEADLQRQRYEELWKKFGPTIIAAVLAIVLATGAGVAWRAHVTQVQQTDTDTLMTAANDLSLSPQQRIDALAKLGREAKTPGPAVLGYLQGAAQAFDEGDVAKASALYDALANDKNVSEAVYRHYGDLLYVQSQMDAGDPAALIARLTPLQTDPVWGQMAREYTGYLTLKAGHKDEAQQIFERLATEQGPAALIARARDMAGWIAQTK